MTNLQQNYSEIAPIILNSAHKSPKVNKMLAILKAAGVIPNNDGTALDIGCSAGFFCEGLATEFKQVIGVDIDSGAIEFAKKQQVSQNIVYTLINDDTIPMPNESLDLVMCNHVYEHVPSADKLFSEIFRVLKPTGVCYLGAANKLIIMEPHYKLPFLSWVPKFVAHRYMRIFKRGDVYYENLRTYGGILRMIHKFEKQDFTIDVMTNPIKFSAADMINPNGIIPKLPIFIFKLIYPFLPSYIFVLRKPASSPSGQRT